MRRPSGVRRGGRPPTVFRRLGRTIHRHPWRVILLWVALVALALPLLPHLGSATTSSSLNLPSDAPSQKEARQAAAVFPASTVQADSLLLLQMPNATSASARDATLGLTSDIQNDTALVGLVSVVTLYSSYRSYLDGQVQMALGVLGPATLGPSSVLAYVNGTAGLYWGTAATYVAIWQAMVQGDPSAPPATLNDPAYRQAMLEPGIAGNATALAALGTFYQEFNGSANCAASPATVVPCADGAVRSYAPFGPPPCPPPAPNPPLVGCVELDALARAIVGDLALENFTSWPSVRNLTLDFLAEVSDLPLSLLQLAWTAFPSAVATPAEVDAFAGGVVEGGTVGTYPVPVPTTLRSQFVSPGNNVTVLIFVLHESDDSPGARSVVNAIDALAGPSLTRTVPGGGVAWVQTGDAALVVNEDNVINADTDAILPITIALLLIITSLYFRAPLTPLLVLITIGVGLLLGLGAMVITTMVTGPVTQTSLTLLVTFVMGVGTDYSVFLVARYREELWRGRSHRAALVIAVTWAGESIATSGTTVVLATLAMTFSGTQLIANWGQVLSLGVAISILVALTLVPAVLALLGPRLFWPYTGARFRRQAERRAKALTSGGTYFQRASRLATRRPGLVLGVAALVSLPLVYVALTAPLSYSYFGQLPSDQPAAHGMAMLAGNFGPGYVFPLDVLVTFQTPLVGPDNASDPGEFAQAAYLADSMTNASGVRSVDALTGPGGAPLATWQDLALLPPTLRAELLATLAGFVGNDGRTVLYTVALSANGNSNEAVAAMDRIGSNLSAFVAGHPSISAVYLGGAPSETKDLQTQLASSSAMMETIIVVGLLLVLLVALGSAVLPPLAIVTIGLSAAWAWALTFAVFVMGLGLSLFFYVPPVLFLLIMGLGMDYNIFILTRIREERLKGNAPKVAVVDAVAHTAGIITAAAVILGGAFFALLAAQVSLLRVLGFAVGSAVILDALVVRTYLVPAMLGAAGDRIWWTPRFLRGARPSPADEPVRSVVETAGARAARHAAAAAGSPRTLPGPSGEDGGPDHRR